MLLRTEKLRVLFLSICLAAVCGAHAPGQDEQPNGQPDQTPAQPGRPAARAPANVPPGMVALTFGNQVDIRMLVDYVAARLNKNFIYDESLTGSVTLRSPHEVPTEALMGILESVLEFKGYALTPTPEGFIKVVPTSVAISKNAPWLPPEEIGLLPDRETIVTQVIQLKFADPSDIVNVLQSGGSSAAVSVAPAPRGVPRTPGPVAPAAVTSFGGSGSAKITTIPERKLLIVTDYATNIQRMLKIINMLDVPGAAPQWLPIPLHYIRAEDYAQKIQTLIEARYPSDSGGRKAMIDYDSRINALLVVAPVSLIQEIQGFTAALDVPAGESERPYRIIFLKNSQAEDLIATLQEIITAAPASPGSEAAAPGSEAVSRETSAATYPAPNRPTSMPTTAGGPRPAPRGGESSKSSNATSSLSLPGLQVSIVADKHANALILVGPPAEQETVAAVIHELDRRRPQVMIEALVVEVSGADQSDIGAELAYTKPLGHNGAGGYTSFGLTSLDTAGNQIFTTGSGLTGFVVSGGDLTAVAHLFSQRTNGKVVSRPKALVNDNEAATFKSEQEQPYTQLSALNTSTTTTSFQDYARAGITMEITPHISEANYLQLEINVNLSAFTGDAPSAETPPPRNTNSIQTKVTVPDNSTVLLGGLNQTTRTEVVRKVPLLGDIPLLGAAFRRTTINNPSSTLYIFVKSRIARAEDFSDLKEMGEKASQNVLSIENLQRTRFKKVNPNEDVFESPAFRPEGYHEP